MNRYKGGRWDTFEAVGEGDIHSSGCAFSFLLSCPFVLAGEGLLVLFLLLRDLRLEDLEDGWELEDIEAIRLTAGVWERGGTTRSHPRGMTDIYLIGSNRV